MKIKIIFLVLIINSITQNFVEKINTDKLLNLLSPEKYSIVAIKQRLCYCNDFYKFFNVYALEVNSLDSSVEYGFYETDTYYLELNKKLKISYDPTIIINFKGYHYYIENIKDFTSVRDIITAKFNKKIITNNKANSLENDKIFYCESDKKYSEKLKILNHIISLENIIKITDKNVCKKLELKEDELAYIKEHTIYDIHIEKEISVIIANLFGVKYHLMQLVGTDLFTDFTYNKFPVLYIHQKYKDILKEVMYHKDVKYKIPILSIHTVVMNSKLFNIDKYGFKDTEDVIIYDNLLKKNYVLESEVTKETILKFVLDYFSNSLTEKVISEAVKTKTTGVFENLNSEMLFDFINKAENNRVLLFYSNDDVSNAYLNIFKRMVSNNTLKHILFGRINIRKNYITGYNSKPFLFCYKSGTLDFSVFEDLIEISKVENFISKCFNKKIMLKLNLEDVEEDL